METTYVTQLLRGTESGRYLALDLGSTNFRSVKGTAAGSSEHTENQNSLYEIAESCWWNCLPVR